MPCERTFVQLWNGISVSFGVGRPIYNYAIKANFLELSTANATKLNSFYMKYLPLRGTNFRVDVLNNRRHQFIGVFMPAALLTTFFIQYTHFQMTKVPKIVSQVPAKGWEVPEEFHLHHTPDTPSQVAYWKKRKEMGHQAWDYGAADKTAIFANAHPWYHGQDVASHGGH
jgi:hypothetical protein